MKQEELMAVLKHLAQIPPVTVEVVDDLSGGVVTWFQASASDALGFLMLDGALSPAARSIVGVELVRWSRAASATRRVWQRREREYREWRAAFVVSVMDTPDSPPPAAPAVKGTKEPKPPKAHPQWVVEEMYRSNPVYRELSSKSERAEEAHQVCVGIADAWKRVAALLGEESEPV